MSLIRLLTYPWRLGSRLGERSAHYVDKWIWGNHQCGDVDCKIRCCK